MARCFCTVMHPTQSGCLAWLWAMATSAWPTCTHPYHLQLAWFGRLTASALGHVFDHFWLPWPTFLKRWMLIQSVYFWCRFWLFFMRWSKGLKQFCIIWFAQCAIFFRWWSLATILACARSSERQKLVWFDFITADLTGLEPKKCSSFDIQNGLLFSSRCASSNTRLYCILYFQCFCCPPLCLSAFDPIGFGTPNTCQNRDSIRRSDDTLNKMQKESQKMCQKLCQTYIRNNKFY